MAPPPPRPSGPWGPPADTDGDGLSDGDEINLDEETDPTDPDSDDDGYNDGTEILSGSDPNDPLSLPPAPPYLINYQGRLADPDGLPLNGTVQIIFRLFDVPVGGVALWSETQTVEVAAGIYHILLGSESFINPAAFQDRELYLEVEVEGETLLPRSRIAAAPLAIHSDRAFGGRLETDTRSVNLAKPENEFTVNVSFKEAFNSTPVVMVSPIASATLDKSFVPGRIINITPSGFSVSFRCLSGATTITDGEFSYMAFGE